MTDLPARPHDYTGHELATDPLAARAVKRPLPVHAAMARASGVLQTHEGPVSFRPGDALLEDGEGWRWPVRRERFDAGYEPVPPTCVGDDGLYVKRPRVVHVRRMTQPFIVRAGHAADTLQGRAGDWLVQYGPSEYGIVAAEVFERTYERLGC